MNIAKWKITEKVISQYVQNLQHFLVFFINHEDVHISSLYCLLSFLSKIIKDYIIFFYEILKNIFKINFFNESYETF